MAQRAMLFVPLVLAAAAYSQGLIILDDEEPRPPRNAGIQTAILVETEDGYRRMSSNETFFDGQRFRLRVTAEAPGYLYTLCLNSQGSALVLFPNNQGDPSNHLSRRSSLTIPDSGWFQFDDEPGIEQVYLIISGRPIAELERASQRGGMIDRRMLDRYTRGGDSSKGIGFSREDMLVRRIDLQHESRRSRE